MLLIRPPSEKYNGILELESGDTDLTHKQYVKRILDPVTGFRAFNAYLDFHQEGPNWIGFQCEHYDYGAVEELELTRKVMQTKTGDKGDCARAAIATYLGLPLSAVPDFIETSDGIARNFWMDVEDFFESHGFTFYEVGLSRSFAGEERRSAPADLWLASGTTVRSESSNRTHMVVMKGFDLYHDPHPSNAGLLKINHAWQAKLRDVHKAAKFGRQVTIVL